MFPIYVTVNRNGSKPRFVGVGGRANDELSVDFKFNEAGTSVRACAATLKMSRDGKAILHIEVAGKETQVYEFDTGS